MTKSWKSNRRLGHFKRMPRCVDQSGKRTYQKAPDFDPDRDERTTSLNALGFRSHSGYLKSRRWRAIRARKLAQDPKCFRCKRNATVVHHRSYGIAVIRGDDLGQLMSMCRFCHDKCHDGPKNASIANATGRLKQRGVRFKDIKRIREESEAREYQKTLERWDAAKKSVRQAKEGNLSGAGQGTLTAAVSPPPVPRRLRDRGET